MINRRPSRERFTVVSNVPIRDESLSWKARGVLMYLLSMPDNWNVVVAQLVQQAPDGKASVMSALAELEDAGYLTRERSHGDDGRFDGLDCVVNEEPIVETTNRKSESGGTIIRFSTRGKSDTKKYLDLISTKNPLLVCETSKDVTKKPSASSTKETTEKIGDHSTEERDARLCDILADAIAANGVERPRVTTKWLNDMRLLQDRDNRSELEIRRVIAWCQADPFWKSNILSVAKLRKHFVALQMKSRTSAPVDVDALCDEAWRELQRRFAKPDSAKENAIVDEMLTRATLAQYGRMANDEVQHIIRALAHDRSNHVRVGR